MDRSLSELSDAEFDEAVTLRIERVQAAWDALQASLGLHLERASAPLADVEALWREMEDSEASLEVGWQELSRRKDRRLGR